MTIVFSLLILLEIALSAALLWLFFKLGDCSAFLKSRLPQSLVSLRQVRDNLVQLETGLGSARYTQALILGKWALQIKLGVVMLEKLSKVVAKA